MTMASIVITAPAGNSIGTMYQLNSLQWAISFTWTPSQSQVGNHIICATATDVSCFASNMHCYTVLAGGQSAAPIQSSLSPKGLLSGATLAGNNGVINWQVTFDNGIELTTTPAYVKFYNSANTLLFQIDITSFPGVTLTNNITLSFQTGNGFPAGNYYILMDPNIGTLGGTGGCIVGSSGISSSSFWTFSIASSAVSTTTLATAIMPNVAATGQAISSTASAILPAGQTTTTTLAPGATFASSTSTLSTSTTTTTTVTSTTTTQSTTTTTTTTLTTSTTTTTTLFNTTTISLPTTNCNKMTFISIIAGIWCASAVIHSLLFFAFLFTITNF